MAYRVRLRQFDGPFDLLVYLIENSRMDIYDIKISEITSQYIEFLGTMQDMNVEVSSDFLVLAAELVKIKSQMLLPRAPQDISAGEPEEDPRERLVSQILEYQKCRRAGEALAECYDRAARSFEKPCDDISQYVNNPEVYLDLDTDDLAKAFNSFLSRKHRIEEARRRYTRLERDRETMQNRMLMIRDIFRSREADGQPDSVDFRRLIPKKSDVSGRYETVVSFTSMLEMMRERYLDADQEYNFGDITVKRGTRDWDDELPGVDEDLAKPSADGDSVPQDSKSQTSGHPTTESSTKEPVEKE